MANAKFIDATTWGNLTEIDVTDGENLFPQLPAGTYRPVLSGVDSVTVPALSAGTIDQATPSEGDTLTVSGSNATGSATYQWQKDGVDISGATSASLDTTGEGTGDYRRGVSDGVQGPVYTSAVTVGAAATAPAQMSAPTVTATGSDSISVDRAAAPSDGGSTITSYDLRHSTDESTWTTVTGISDPQTVSGLTASTLYYVQTRAVNAVGAGAWSTSGTATTDAASGILWDDQFLASQTAPMPSYSIGDRLTADTSGAYVRETGFQHVKVYDIGGTRAVQLDDTQNQNELCLYDVGAVSDDRIVSFVIERMPFGNGNRLYGAYTDDNNYIAAYIQADGNWSARVEVGGSLLVNAFITASDPVAGSELTIENDTTAETVSFKIDGVHVSGSPFSVSGGVTSLGAPGFHLYGLNDSDNMALSRFAIEET